MESDNGMFRELLKASGMNKSRLASALCLHKGTVVSWKDSPPPYAIAYLKLYIESKESNEFRRSIKAFISG